MNEPRAPISICSDSLGLVQEKTMAPRFLARQLSHPSGIPGAVIMFLMNRTNAKMNAFAFQKLGPASQDRVLEIGFGGGLLLPQLLAQAGHVSGVDRSEKALADARAKFAAQVSEGRADFRQGQVEALPFEASAVDKVLTVNTVYFWTSLSEGFAEIARVLASGGRAAIGFLPKEFMDKMNNPKDIFTSRTPEDVMGAMRDAGFIDVSAERPSPETKWMVVVATKP
jgi:SAM-dependent methyltransferase